MTSSLLNSFLRRSRNTRRQSLAVVAGFAGISPQHLSEIESGKVDARLSTIERVANALGLAVVLVPRDKVVLVRRYLATNGRAFQIHQPGDPENHD